MTWKKKVQIRREQSSIANKVLENQWGVDLTLKVLIEQAMIQSADRVSDVFFCDVWQGCATPCRSFIRQSYASKNTKIPVKCKPPHVTRTNIRTYLLAWSRGKFGLGFDYLSERILNNLSNAPRTTLEDDIYESENVLPVVSCNPLGLKESKCDPNLAGLQI